MKRTLRVIALMLCMIVVVTGCGNIAKSQQAETVSEMQGGADEETNTDVDWTEADKETLRYVFAEEFGGEAGVCLPEAAFINSPRMEIVKKHFNNVTMENEMKPESFLGQEPNIGADGFPVLDFTKADGMLDKLAEYNAGCDKEEKKIRVRGHVLVWHSQTPEWFFHEDYDASKPYVADEVMLARMENYIAQVMGHFYGEESPYKDMIYAWDVVNEAVNDSDGRLRAESSWFNVFRNEEFVVKAFVYANKYAPADVKLFYNDYNDTNLTKCEGICNLIRTIKENPEARIDGMGMQGHHDMNFSVYDFEEAVRNYAAVVDEIQITELDLKSSNDYTGENQDEEYLKQAYVYKSLYDSVKKLVNEEGLPITAIIFWGTDDGNSWLQSSNSVGGSADGSRPQCPLLFDAAFGEKPALYAFTNPQVLPPKVQECVAIEGQDFTMAQAASYQADEIKVEFCPIWNSEGLRFKVMVLDDSENEEDSITVYVDPTDSRKEGADVLSVTVNRKDAKTKQNRYDAEVTVPLRGLGAAQDIGFDICVNNGGTLCSWNDTNNTQELGSVSYGRMMLKPYTEITYGKAAIDGVAEAVWENVKELPLSIETKESADVEATATGKVLWDEEALYVYVEVTDPNMDVSGSEVHTQDSVEIFVDEINNKTKSYGSDDKQYRVNCENVCSFNGPICREEFLTSAVTKTETGYAVEAAIRWSAITPQAGMNIGFELQINDCKGGTRLGMCNWFDKTNTCWSSPASYGTAKLIDNSIAE